MSRLKIKDYDRARRVMDGLYLDTERKISGMPPGICPVDVVLTFLHISQTQSCGKCVPCRIGLEQLANLLRDVLSGKGTMDTLKLIRETAMAISDSADCAIGTEGAKLVLKALDGFSEDFEEHVRHNHCISKHQHPVPCVSLCPASVDIPGYIALINEDRCEDAVRLIRKDNPFPSACAYICEHPCELRCRRRQIDAPLNIRGLKRYAVENAVDPPQPQRAPSTGKRVAVIGGGPSGLTAAYYLSLMGHEVEVFERRKQLGGMLRYGIPAYRFPREIYDREIESILSVGIKAHTDVNVGTDISWDELDKGFDAIYIAIGAQTDNKIGLPGEDAEGVISAVELLRGIGDGEHPDFTGMNIVVVGGGNVAMDANRTSLRLGAKKVTCVYRRRLEDMTALREEVTGAMAEGVDMQTLMAPVRIKVEDGKAVALVAQPQLTGLIDRAGRPAPYSSDEKEVEYPADLIIMAVGQAIDSGDFEAAGVTVERGRIVAGLDCKVADMDKVFSGGDCASGPSTAIAAIAAGKTAAANIDEYLGFDHKISVDVEIPAPRLRNKDPRGRISNTERPARERIADFVDVENCMTCQGAKAESGRCLRCDYFGYGIFRGGRTDQW